jgi:hypothetical protein
MSEVMSVFFHVLCRVLNRKYYDWLAHMSEWDWEYYSGTHFDSKWDEWLELWQEGWNAYRQCVKGY